MKSRAVVFFSMVFVCSFISAVYAENASSDVSGTELVSKTEPVYFSGDRFAYDTKDRIITGTGDVEVIQGQSTLQGDTIILDLPNNNAEIEGNVIGTYLDKVVEGERGSYDFAKGEGVFHDARGHSKPWYVTADEVEREIVGRYVVENASMTTCDLPHPHYHLKSGSITVIPEERVVARRITLYAGSVPVFYLPYYSQGLGPGRPPLEFSAGTQSDVGAYARIGYNLELSEEVSLKPHVTGFTKSGVGVGLDGRLSLFEGDGKGRFDSFYIHDLNRDNTEEPGINEDRGKGDLYYRQELPHDWVALLQAEYISDREFLKTYDFDDFSDRELPESFINIERTFDHAAVSLTANERLVDYITEVERQPQLRLELLEQRIGDTGFFFSAANRAAYLNIEADGPESARNVTEGRLSYPIRLWKWLGLVPYIGSDATYYSKALNEDDEYRLSWQTGIAAQSRFHKVFGSPFERYTSFRHLFVPTVKYLFRPTPDNEPDELPQFDSVDAIDRSNMVELELRNYLQAKRQDGVSIDLAQYNVTAGLEFDDAEDKLAMLENEFLLRPVPNWEVALKSFSDFRDETRSDLVSAILGYTKPEAFKASAGVIHEDTVLKRYETQLVYSLSKAFGPQWRAGIEQRYDLADDEFSFQELWVWRDLHCWEVLVQVRDRREATSVMVVFNIKAFPLKKIKRKTSLEPLQENHPWPTRW